MSSLTSISSHLVLLLALVIGCGDDSSVADTGASDTGADDTGTDDSGAADSGAADTGAADTGTADTGTADTGTDDAATRTPCGSETCDPATEVCFECACGGPATFACTPVPAACSEDRSCACIGPELCTTGLMACTDRGDNHVFCDTGLD